MIVTLNSSMLTTENKEDRYGRLHYPKVFFNHYYKVIKEFDSVLYGKMIEVESEILTDSIVFIKNDCTIIEV